MIGYHRPGFVDMKAGGKHSARDAAYLKWLDETDFDLNGCTIGVSYPKEEPQAAHATGVRGVIATKDLPEEHKLFCVPKHAILLASASTYGLRIKNARLPQGAALAVALCLEDLDEESPWREYLDVLPETLDTPHFWDENERELLGGTRVVERANLDEVHDFYKRSIRPRFPKVPLKQFVRFGAILVAYSFTIESPEGPVLAMLPFADALNSTPTGTNTNAYLLDDGSFEMTTTSPVKCGEELINTYGERCNAELLTRYGYVAENPIKSIGISFDELSTAAKQSSERLCLSRLKAVIKYEKKKGHLPLNDAVLEYPFVTTETVIAVQDVGSILAPLLWKVVDTETVRRVCSTKMKQLESAKTVQKRLTRGKKKYLYTKLGRRAEMASCVREECFTILEALLVECRKKEQELSNQPTKRRRLRAPHIVE